MLISALSIYSYFKRAPGKGPKSFSRQGSTQFCTDSGNPVSVVSEVEQDPPCNHYGEAEDQHPGAKAEKKKWPKSSLQGARQRCKWKEPGTQSQLALNGSDGWSSQQRRYPYIQGKATKNASQRWTSNHCIEKHKEHWAGEMTHWIKSSCYWKVRIRVWIPSTHTGQPTTIS